MRLSIAITVQQNLQLYLQFWLSVLNVNAAHDCSHAASVVSFALLLFRATVHR